MPVPLAVTIHLDTPHTQRVIKHRKPHWRSLSYQRARAGDSDAVRTSESDSDHRLVTAVTFVVTVTVYFGYYNDYGLRLG
jgi:hypothetical protein